MLCKHDIDKYHTFHGKAPLCSFTFKILGN